MQKTTSFILILFIVICGLPLTALSQVRCGTVEITHQKSGIKHQADFEQWLNKKIRDRALVSANKRTQSTYQIPVVVHIIHNGESVGTGTNISDAQVISQITVLNEDYQRLNADATNTPAAFLPLVGSMDVEFVLAKRTPEGLPTNGIVRKQGTQSAWTSGDDVTFKGLSYWDSEQYLNIWVLNITDFLGYSQFPVSTLPGLEGSPDVAETDGVVINYQVFGSEDHGSFDLDPNYNKGRTTTHEVAHFFGLRHIWGDDGGACGGDGDFVSDTPDQTNYTTGCTSPVKCGTTVPMYQNFMDYTDDECMNLFTQEQVQRMITVLENSPRRASLLTSDGLSDPDPITTENLTLTRIEGPVVTCSNQADITLNLKNNGVAITSFKVVINGTTTIPFTGLSFASGGEATFTLPGIVLAGGINNFVIQVTEPNGDADTFPADNVGSYMISSNEVMDVIPMKEDFEGSFGDKWVSLNPRNGMNWATETTNFGTSLYFNAFNNATIGDQAWLVSPVLDLADAEAGSLGFDVSYRYRNGKNDNLKVLGSTDCGQTFNVTLFNESADDIQPDNLNARWIPLLDDEWRHIDIQLGSLLGEEQVRIAFVFTNANGNNLFLDNIEFFNTDESTPKDGRSYLQVFPSGVFQTSDGAVTPSVRLNLPQRSDVTIDVISAQGKEMFSFDYGNALNQTIELPMEDAAPGLYVLRVKTSNNTYAEKFIMVR